MEVRCLQWVPEQVHVGLELLDSRELIWVFL